MGLGREEEEKEEMTARWEQGKRQSNISGAEPGTEVERCRERQTETDRHLGRNRYRNR